MSKHLFSTTAGQGQRVEVDCGWDRPLQYFFLTVFGPKPGDNHDERFELVLYESLTEPGGGFEKVKQVEAKLKELGIKPPALLYERLQGDKQANRGNSVTNWDGEQARTDQI